MRKLILEVQMTVDGYVADPEGYTNWQVWNWDRQWNWDEKLKEYFTGLMGNIDCILLSRKMAKEGFITHWKNAAMDPADPRYEYAKTVNDMHKVVFSTTMQQSEWENINLAKGDLTEEVNKLKAQDGKDMIVYGGATFASSLIKAGLIDEYQLFINPTAIGKGMTIFNELTQHMQMELVNATPYKCGIVVIVYRPKG